MQLKITVKENEGGKDCTIQAQTGGKKISPKKFKLLADSLTGSLKKALDMLHKEEFGTPFNS